MRRWYPGMLGQVIHGYRADRALSVDKGGYGDAFFATLAVVSRPFVEEGPL